jgi:hypothetical protein
MFFSSYVFELLPSSAYGLRVLRIAHELLRPGGIALVQIRYRTGPYLPVDARLDYADTWVHSTTYTIDGFWKAMEEIGFEPLYVTLVPEQPELNESRYAYFALKR